MRIALFDYGAGNLHSLKKALEVGGADVEAVTDWDRALDTDALVLPGVGAFGAAVAALGDAGPRVRDALESGYPCLGICLGMQLLFDESEESPGTGIGLIPGRVRRLHSRIVPHMGWNEVETGDDSLFAGATPLFAYYANSYVCEPEDSGCAIAWTEYEGERFAAAVRSGSAWGVQFHPEKSSAAGLRVVRNFLEKARRA
ncbi:MAG: imidazole glycerol phosphate synthase subunit HisH [Gemmatimonadetes bacterium]|nr:imidazole glycerol phosphate synthase subunit HisH [Gemmatimonadota bacterium]